MVSAGTGTSVDQRMLDILRVKADEFNECARRSALKYVTPTRRTSPTSPRRRRRPHRAENERRIIQMERAPCAWSKRRRKEGR